MRRARTLAERVAGIEGVDVTGTFMRHAAPGRDAFAGGYGGRWGASLPVIYLGRPEATCVEEAYRHLVDATGVPAHLIKARTLYRARVGAENILDLRPESAQSEVGLTITDLTSEVGDYEACQRVAAVAHQLEYHGVIAPAATRLGVPLALFRRRIGVNELPIVVDQERWERLPTRPGTEPVRLSIVKG